jgi:hypothetical protein
LPQKCERKFFDDKMKIYLQQNHDETIQLAQQQIISNPDKCHKLLPSEQDPFKLQSKLLLYQTTMPVAPLPTLYK